MIENETTEQKCDHLIDAAKFSDGPLKHLLGDIKPIIDKDKNPQAEAAYLAILQLDTDMRTRQKSPIMLDSKRHQNIKAVFQALLTQQDPVEFAEATLLINNSIELKKMDPETNEYIFKTLLTHPCPNVFAKGIIENPESALLNQAIVDERKILLNNSIRDRFFQSAKPIRTTPATAKGNNPIATTDIANNMAI